ncbi:structural maintenance of chromosomes (SMC)family protein [Striga asiatica]|uniref:Structural maintenance of chromosomes (SMC)family protein n=1 Tax=Striga asiatica TaxID=4170 RepID=A0A5A7PDV1_STRAF|nr:structural maintenance of chromosomes (SMC)family protein [Striga asiatica]
MRKPEHNPSDKPGSSVGGCSPVTKAIVADNNGGQLSCQGKKTELAVLIPMELDSNCEKKGDESYLVDIPVGDPLIQESVIGRKKKSFVKITRKVEADSKLNLSTGKSGLNLDNKEGCGSKRKPPENPFEGNQIPKEHNKIKEERLLLLVREWLGKGVASGWDKIVLRFNDTSLSKRLSNPACFPVGLQIYVSYGIHSPLAVRIVLDR